MLLVCLFYHQTSSSFLFFFFFFNDTATTEIYTLSLHDALPILSSPRRGRRKAPGVGQPRGGHRGGWFRRELIRVPPIEGDRKSTRLNSSHLVISYAVFCLKKKKKIECRYNI